MYSLRFERTARITRHARQRMQQRQIDDGLLAELIEHGECRYKNSQHLWIADHFEGRDDNLICAAVVLETELVVKTVMHKFVWE